jgi:hypothetical protein
MWTRRTAWCDGWAQMVTRVYVDGSPDNAEEAVLVTERHRWILLGLDGTPHAADWDPPRLELLARDRGKALKYSDIPSYPTRGVVLLRPPAVEALGDLLRPDGELLPVLCDQADLTLFNCTRVIDALDEDRSTIARFRDGRIMMIESLALRAGAVPPGVNAFRLPQNPKAPVYFSQAVVDAARAAKLVRCNFELVWEDVSSG